jgi:peptidoglycan/xylan/chitin deacetylase (PgdA/CDA1 family)
MISHSYIRGIAILSFAILLVAYYALDYSFWFLAVPILVYVAMSAVGSYFIGSNYYLAAHCRGSENKKVIALTFDDGPHPIYTPIILDILEQHKVKAAFFVIGKWAEKYPELLKRIHDEGHLIGNHSYEHNFGYPLKSNAQLLADAVLCDDIITQNILKRPLFYRPPFGVTNPGIKYLVETRKYYCIGWSLRTYDTIAKDAIELKEKSIRMLKNGAIMLLHDRLSVTCEALPGFLEEVKKEGYRMERVDVLLQLQAYS